MRHGSSTTRSAAAFIAVAAWIGLGVQLAASTSQVGSPAAAAWVMLRYFTVLTNLVVAIAFTSIALGSTRLSSSRLLGGVTLSIALVGVIYILLLRGLIELSGGAVLADFLMHTVTPLATVCYWLVFAGKGGLRWRDPALWALYPLVYTLYALARGEADGRYPYPFLDVGTLGLGAVLINCALIFAGFMVAGWGMVALDRPLVSRNQRPA